MGGTFAIGPAQVFLTSDSAKDQVEAAKHMLGKGLASHRGDQNG